MKLVQLTLAAAFAVLLIPICGFCAEEQPLYASPDVVGEHHHTAYVPSACSQAGPAGRCQDSNCLVCWFRGPVCPSHGSSCPYGCVKNQYSYGRVEVCPGKTNGVCPVHGYGQCPHPNQGLRPFIRQAFAPADRPYFGMQPLYVPREHYDPNFQPRFPRLRSLFVMPAGADARYMTTTPPEQMNTYTTRGPRDFLMPNPPSIGY